VAHATRKNTEASAVQGFFCPGHGVVHAEDPVDAGDLQQLSQLVPDTGQYQGRTEF
jgi:hypothetical protein